MQYRQLGTGLARFGDRARLLRHERRLRRARRRGVDRDHPPLHRARHHHARHLRRLCGRRQRGAGRPGRQGQARQVPHRLASSATSAGRAASAAASTASPTMCRSPARRASSAWGSTPSISITSIASTPTCRSRTRSAPWRGSSSKARCAISACARPAPTPSGAPTRLIRSPRSRPNIRCGRATSRRRSCRRCKELGIGLVPYSPLGRGFLSRQLSPSATISSRADRRHAHPRFQEGNFEKNLSLLGPLKTAAEKRGVHHGADRARLAAGARRQHRADPGHQAAQISRGERSRGRHHADRRRGRKRSSRHSRRRPPPGCAIRSSSSR